MMLGFLGAGITTTVTTCLLVELTTVGGSSRLLQAVISNDMDKTKSRCMRRFYLMVENLSTSFLATVCARRGG